MKPHRKTFEMAFKDPKKLNAMLTLRRNGWTLKSLALIFNVDHSSIYKACKIRGITRPLQTISFDLPTIISLVGIKEYKVKTYQDYLEEQRRRRFPKLYANVTY